MGTTLAVLNDAFARHQAGRLEEAEAIYRRILEQEPEQADALHLLGMVHHERGSNQTAAELIARAVRQRPDISMFHNNLGNVLLAQRRPAEALLCFEQAIHADPKNFEAFSNAGNAFQELRRPADAVPFYERALEYCPDSPEILNNLGNALRGSRRMEDALRRFEQAVTIRPHYAEAHLNRGNVMQELMRFTEAEAAYAEAIRLQPRLAEAYSNVAALRIAQQRWGEAEHAANQALECGVRTPDLLCNLAAIQGHRMQFEESARLCREALRLNPDHPEAHNSLGASLEELGFLGEALVHCERALELKPELPEAHLNLGNIVLSCGASSGSIRWYRRAIELRPALADAHWNLALALLRQGRFEEGWREYEWRWRRPGACPRGLPGPVWDGAAPANKRILVYAEQGFGDNLQFARYARPLAESGATVILECRREILPLLATAPGVSETVEAGYAPPPYDYHVAMMSLPGLLGTRPESIPRPTGFYVDPSGHKEIRERIQAGRGLRVGLTWSGNPEFRGNSRRSFEPAEWSRLLEVPGVNFYSLQKGEEWRDSTPPEILSLYPWIEDLCGVAAAVSSMDLVIAVDTMAAHLAGTLGVPVWILLAQVADWRWFEDRDDSPWYPSARLFRQRSRGDWHSVVERVACELSRIISS